MTLKAHMNALQTFLNTNYSNAIIFEDDVMKVAPFSWGEVRTLMADMLSLDRNDWDIQYHGSCYSEPFDFDYKGNILLKYPSDKNVYFRALNAFCLHAVVYNRVAAEIFLTQWMPFREAVDTILSELICKYGEPHDSITDTLFHSFIP
jgi:GR25 family glycosyltransferase involved in LPS biosynthesis